MGTIFQRGAVWWIQYHHRGQRFRESSHSPDRAEAQRLLALRLGALARGEPVVNRQATVADLCAELVTDYRVNGRRSLDVLTLRLACHILPAFGTLKATELTTSHVRQYIQARQAEGAANGTINREIAVLHRAYVLAQQAGQLPVVPHMPLLKEADPRQGFVTRDQLDTVCRYLPAHVQPVIRFAYLTAWRIGEVRNLHWRHVDFTERVLRLAPSETKNGKSRIFPLTDELHALLQTQREYTADCERALGRIIPCCWHRDGVPLRSLRGAWRTACRRAGLPGLLIHDLRRSGVRNFTRAGIPEQVAMQLSGHLTAGCFRRYNITSEADLRLAADKLNAWGVLGSSPANLLAGGVHPSPDIDSAHRRTPSAGREHRACVSADASGSVCSVGSAVRARAPNLLT